MRPTTIALLTLVLVLSGRLALPSEARAQLPRPLNDTISAGITAGVGGGAPIDGGFELGGTVEVPLSLDFRVRADAAVGLWEYGGNPGLAAPAATFWRHRVTGTLIRPLIPLGPGRPVGSYAGGGAGVYIMRFRDQPDAVSGGGHAVWGLEFLSPERRWLINAEVQILFVKEPHQSAYGYSRGTGLGVHAGIAVKRRLS